MVFAVVVSDTLAFSLGGPAGLLAHASDVPAAVDDSTALSLALLVLRTVVGVTLALHGIAKYRSGIAGVANWFRAEGLRPGLLHAHLAALTEICAGLALTLGLLTPLAGSAVVGVMATAGWVGHRRNGFFIISDGWEYVFVLAAAAACLAATGPGDWSLDSALGLQLRGAGWLAVAAAGGSAAAVLLLAVFYRPAPRVADTPSADDS